MLSNGWCESHYIVTSDLLDLLDSLDREVRLLFDCLDCLLGNLPLFSQDFANGNLNF